MKSLAIVTLLSLAACGTSISGGSSGSGSSGDTSGGTGSGSTSGGTCPQQLCGGVCCPAGAPCFTGANGTPSCEISCTSTSDCTGNTPPCCETIADSKGNFGTAGLCGDATLGATCLCKSSAECGSEYICAPGSKAGRTPSTGVFVGPYICVLNDGHSLSGCENGVVCEQPTQSCASDKAGTQFCSPPCTGDAQCGNTGVACCDETCDAGLTCCGLCGH